MIPFFLSLLINSGWVSVVRCPNSVIITPSQFFLASCLTKVLFPETGFFLGGGVIFLIPLKLAHRSYCHSLLHGPCDLFHIFQWRLSSFLLGFGQEKLWNHSLGLYSEPISSSNTSSLSTLSTPPPQGRLLNFFNLELPSISYKIFLTWYFFFDLLILLSSPCTL